LENDVLGLNYGRKKMSDVEKTLQERGERYGDFTDHATIAQTLQDVMRDVPGWRRLSPVQKQAMTVIADKQARILSGDPNYRDNWHDIQGYAKLAEDRCQNFDPRQESMSFHDAVMPEIRHRQGQSFAGADMAGEADRVKEPYRCIHGKALYDYCDLCPSTAVKAIARKSDVHVEPDNGEGGA
jgi:hypothetical protein